MVQGLGFRVWGLGFRVKGYGFRATYAHTNEKDTHFDQVRIWYMCMLVGLGISSFDNTFSCSYIGWEDRDGMQQPRASRASSVAAHGVWECNKSREVTPKGI